MKFQFKSKKKIITGVARQHSSQTSHIETFRKHLVPIIRFQLDISRMISNLLNGFEWISEQYDLTWMRYMYLK